MANTIFKLRRSSVAGKVPNTSTLAIGELGLNLTDRKLFSSDGTNVWETGANLTNLSVSNTANINTLYVTTNTSTFGTTMYVVANGNVGIGTSTPSYRLDIQANTGSNHYIQVKNNGAGRAGIVLNAGGTSDGGVIFQNQGVGTASILSLPYSSNAPLIFYANNGTSMAEIARFLNGGNFGIGNTTPAHKLRVEGATSISGNLSIETSGELILANGAGIYSNGTLGVNGQVLATNGSSTYWFTPIGGVLPLQLQYTGDGSTTSFAVAGGYIPNSISVFLNGVLLRNGSEVTVTSGTNFVISPAPSNGSLIDVIGPSRLYSTGVNTVVNQQITANGTANSFAISGGYIPNTLLVFLNGVKQAPNTDVAITSGANVGFYTTPSNGNIIDIYGYQTTVGLGANAITVGSNVTIGSDSITVGNSTVNTQITAGNIALNGSTLLIGNSTSNVVITGTTLTISNSSSNVSFGTGPASINAIATNTFTIGSSLYVVANGSVGIACTTPLAGYKFTVNGGNIRLQNVDGWITGSNSITLYGDTSSSYGLTVKTDGKVGIGTNSPAFKFDLNGGRAQFAPSSEAYAIGLRYNSSTNGIWLGSPAANSFQISNVGGGSVFYIDGNGNTGIGTTNPQYGKLQVNGKIYAGDTIQSGNSFILQGNGMVTTNSSNNLLFGINEIERGRIDASGNFGINTISPSKKLHIFASGSVSDAPQLLLEGGTNGYGAGITFQSRTSSGGTLVEMARVVADGDSSWNTTASTQDARLSFWTTQDGTAYERMRITSGGNVGIGTSTPAYGRLEVHNNGTNFVLARNSAAGAGISGFVCQNSGDTRGIRIDGGNFQVYDHSAGAVRMQIDGSGRITTPYQPAGSVSWSGTLTRGNIIPFATVNQERFTLWNTSTYRLTAPVAGYYLFTCIGRTAGTGGSDFNISLLHNGSTVVESWAYDTSGGKAFGASLSHIRYLAASDYVQFNFNHDSPSPAALAAAWASYALLG